MLRLTPDQAFSHNKTPWEDEITFARESLSKAKLGYANGQETLVTVLVALVKLQTLRQRQTSLRKELLANQDLLLEALGAKWI